MHMVYLLSWILHPNYRDAAVGVLEASADRYGTFNPNDSLTINSVIQAALYFWDKHKLWTSPQTQDDEHAQLMRDMKIWCQVGSDLKRDIPPGSFQKNLVAFWLPHQSKHPALARLALWVSTVPMKEVVPDDSVWRVENQMYESDKIWYGRNLLKEQLLAASPCNKNSSSSNTTPTNRATGAAAAGGNDDGGGKFPLTMTWSQFMSHWTQGKPPPEHRQTHTHSVDGSSCRADAALQLARFWELSASAGINWSETTTCS